MTTMDSLAEQLAAVDLFGSLRKKDRRVLAKRMKTVEFADGQDIVEEGNISVGFHLILDGSAVVETSARRRNRLGPGDYFGEISLVDGEPRSATVRATSPLRTASMSSWEFHSLLRENPELVSGLLKGLCARLRDAEARVK